MMDIHDVTLKRYWINTTSRASVCGGRYGLWTYGAEHILVSWGYATGPKPGTHNTFDCEVLISYWQGEYLKPEELPNLSDPRWKSVCGFDVPRTYQNQKQTMNTDLFVAMVREHIDSIDDYI